MADKDVESGPKKDDADAPMSLRDAIESSWMEGDEAETPEPEKAPEGGEEAGADAAPDEDDDTPDDREAGEDAGSPEGDDEDEGGGSLSPPDHWPKERREAFAKLPNGARELLLAQSRDLERGFTRKSQELAEDGRLAADVRKVFEPLRDKLQLSGVSEAQAIGQLVAAQQYLERDPAGGLKYLADQYGVDLSKLAQGAKPDGKPDQRPKYVDPDIAAQNDRIAKVESGLTAFQQHQQAERQAAINRQIAEFKEAKDDAGNPAHPHFETVQEHMARLIQSGVASGLKDAYERAVRLDDNLYQQTLEAERKRVEAEAEAKRKEAVAKAKKAGRKVNSDNRPGSQPASGDLRSIISEAFQEHA